EEREKRHKEQELKPLYKELLYTIKHRLGKPSGDAQYSATQLQDYIKEAFGMTDAEHESLSEKVQSSQRPVYCLKVTVKEAKGILGKDISGFSDPYCLLTIMNKDQEGKSSSAPSKPQKAVVKDSAQQGEVFQTDIKKQTLNPVWDQTFALVFQDLSSSNFHLEMWDKDEEVSLVQKFDEFRTNFHGLKRMIKDAKKEKGTDDFLGNVVLKLQDLHCTEDRWCILHPRTETYPDRGQCHLQFKFIHKELIQVLSSQQSAPGRGGLCGEGTTLLEHYAAQNDISPFLQDLAKWVAYSKLYQSLEVDSTVLFQQLTSIEYHWDQQELPYQQKQELGDSLHGFLQYGLCLVSKYRDIFPPTPKTTPRLHTLLRVLVQICKTRAFQKLNPGSEEWFNIKKGLHQPMTKDLQDSVGALSRLIGEVQEDIRLSKDVWNRVFVLLGGGCCVPAVCYGVAKCLLEVSRWIRLASVHYQKNCTTKLYFIIFLSTEMIELHILKTLPIKHSSSAVDLAACLQPICQLWEQLGWPDSEEGFMLMVKLTEDICKIASTYCRLLKTRVKELSDKSDPGIAINMLCVVVNNLEHLRSVLNRLPQQLNWAGLRERTRNVIGETQFQNTLHSQLQHTQAVLNREIRSAVDTLGKKMHTDIEKFVRSMATRHRLPSRSTEDAVHPLMLSQGCLEQCFHAEGNGLPRETLHTEEYKVLQNHLLLNSMSCQQLMEKFFERKVWEQKVCHGEKYGAVTLIISYHRSDGKLHVEVLNAVNLIPLDSNGSSDPFVQLSLEPKHVFPQAEPRTTKIINRDLNPLFEESFEFAVTLEQCQSPGACLVVTVLDHDTLRTDDFEGEAFLSLKAVPGVAGGGAPDPTPAQIRLPLLHPKPNSETTLKLLEARRGEREAQAFVKLRRQRERQSQETCKKQE
uniref:Unc-13 homolog D n=1 Tax=Astyanax mexicanus TaxID=7994 RepID=A0A3B1KK43_ASTMX